MKHIIVFIVVFLTSCTFVGSPGVKTNTPGSVMPIKSDITKIERNISGMFGSRNTIITKGELALLSSQDPAKYYSLSDSQWNNLTSTLDKEKLLSLDQKDPRLTCKACAYDGENMETLTVTFGDTTKSLYYGTESKVDEISLLQNTISGLIMSVSPAPR